MKEFEIPVKNPFLHYPINYVETMNRIWEDTNYGRITTVPTKHADYYLELNRRKGSNVNYIKKLKLKGATEKALAKAGIEKLSQLEALSHDDLSKLPGMAEARIKEINDALDLYRAGMFKVTLDMNRTRSLWQCGNARVRFERVVCAKGHTLNKACKDGSFDMKEVERGKTLELRVCQLCADYDDMGPEIPSNERGWA